MSLLKKIPKDFYKVFSSKYMDYYQQFLVALFEEGSRSYSLLGLTEKECRFIMNEHIGATLLDWSDEQYDEEGVLLTQSNMSAVFLKNLVDWGWLRKDFDEVLNTYVVSFTEYSQMFVELFQKLQNDDEGKERESVLTIYSHLYTYSFDPEKNNQILKSALTSSKALLRMLINMQEGMREYFDELSRQRSLLGIQEVLIKEINNSDSQKYAILTTTDSFYRYKEAVKELIDKNINLCEEKRLLGQGKKEVTEEALELLYFIERQFDVIERRYNQLIEQKTVFAERAAARIRYIFKEEEEGMDQILSLVGVIANANEEKKNEILYKISDSCQLSRRFKVVTEDSFYQRKEQERTEFSPQTIETVQEEKSELEEFILQPVYTQREIQEFKSKNEIDGSFCVTKETVSSVEDLEKLFFVWQEATQEYDSEEEIILEDDIYSEQGYSFSKLSIR